MCESYVNVSSLILRLLVKFIKNLSFIYYFIVLDRRGAINRIKFKF